MSFIPVAVNSPRPLAPRALEVEQVIKRNMLFALSISILMHLLIVAFYYILPSPAIDMSKVKFDKRPQPPWTKTPFDFIPIDPGAVFSGAPPKVTDVQAGKIVSVPDAIADPKITIATQDELKKGLASSGDIFGEGVGTGIGNGPTSNGESIGELSDEPEPPIYVAVERQPVLVRPVIPHYPELMVKASITEPCG